MKKNTGLQIILAVSLLSACAVSSKKNAKMSANTEKTSNQTLAKRQPANVKLNEDLMQDRKDRSRMLQKKREISQNYQARPQNKKMEFSPKLFSQAEKMSERDLYAEMLQAYNQNDSFGFQSYYRSFMKRFAKSSLADDAIYLSGLLALSSKQYGQALVSFNQVLDKYPFSNKTSSALYAKGVSLKRMNLTTESKQVFSQVMKKYPGSPESLRAKVELGIVK